MRCVKLAFRGAICALSAPRRASSVATSISRKLVAVGTARLAFMFRASVAAGPRIGVAPSGMAACGGAGASGADGADGADAAAAASADAGSGAATARAARARTRQGAPARCRGPGTHPPPARIHHRRRRRCRATRGRHSMGPPDIARTGQRHTRRSRGSARRAPSSSVRAAPDRAATYQHQGYGARGLRRRVWSAVSRGVRCAPMDLNAGPRRELRALEARR